LRQDDVAAAAAALVTAIIRPRLATSDVVCQHRADSQSSSCRPCRCIKI